MKGFQHSRFKILLIDAKRCWRYEIFVNFLIQNNQYCKNLSKLHLKTWILHEKLSRSTRSLVDFLFFCIFFYPYEVRENDSAAILMYDTMKRKSNMAKIKEKWRILLQIAIWASKQVNDHTTKPVLSSLRNGAKVVYNATKTVTSWAIYEPNQF